MRVGYRQAAPDDLGFIAQAWLEAYRKWAGPLSKRLYAMAYREQIAEILARPDVRLIVAYEADAPDRIIGFLCWEPGPFRVPTLRGGEWKTYHQDAVHFVYVKLAFRSKWKDGTKIADGGFARRMAERAGLDLGNGFLVSFLTGSGIKVAQHLRLDLSDRPEIVRLPKLTGETACA